MNKVRLVVTSIISIFLVSILFLNGTYAVFTSQEVDENLNVYTTGNLDVTYTLSEDNITMTDASRISIEESKDLRPFRITVTNNGNVPYIFNVILQGTTISDEIDLQYIMTQVGRLEPKVLGNCVDNIIKSDVIVPANEQVIIDVRVWVSDKIKNSEVGKSFFAKLKIDGVATYEKSETVDNSMLIASGKYSNNYCTDLGITSLEDCILISENDSKSTEIAKKYIKEKKTDFSKIAPIITYSSKVEENVSETISLLDEVLIGKKYKFDDNTGNYILEDTSLVKVDDVLSNEDMIFYTCNSTDSSCSTMYVIYEIDKSTSLDVDSYRAVKFDRYVSLVKKEILSEQGLYMAEDDYGESYYFRGSVGNNYVSFAGLTWRIVRINGDGSIRLVYSGINTVDSKEYSSIGTSNFNNNYFDSFMVGYRYGLSKEFQSTTSKELVYNYIDSNIKYYFGTNYKKNETEQLMMVSGEVVEGTLEEIWNNDKYRDYRYTCFNTTLTDGCSTLVEIDSYVSSNEVKVNAYHSYLSKDYESTYSDELDSSIKEQIDEWYKINIQESGYADYVSDNLFCNDRSLIDGDGYSLNKTSIYGARDRVFNKSIPSLKCLRKEDQFTVKSNDTIGNGKLIYPVGLLNVDEVIYAGGNNLIKNPSYYLYTGQKFWTMSPAYFSTDNLNGFGFSVDMDGSIIESSLNMSLGIRPVINLKHGIEIESGNGTKHAPYVIKKM